MRKNTKFQQAGHFRRQACPRPCFCLPIKKERKELRSQSDYKVQSARLLKKGREQGAYMDPPVWQELFDDNAESNAVIYPAYALGMALMDSASRLLIKETAFQPLRLPGFAERGSTCLPSSGLLHWLEGCQFIVFAFRQQSPSYSSHFVCPRHGCTRVSTMLR